VDWFRTIHNGDISIPQNSSFDLRPQINRAVKVMSDVNLHASIKLTVGYSHNRERQKAKHSVRSIQKQ